MKVSYNTIKLLADLGDSSAKQIITLILNANISYENIKYVYIAFVKRFDFYENEFKHIFVVEWDIPSHVVDF